MSIELIDANGPCPICGFNQNLYAKGKDLKVPFRGELRHYPPLSDIQQILVTDTDGKQWTWDFKLKNWICLESKPEGLNGCS